VCDGDPVDQEQIEQQIERCRRLASILTDEEMRQSLHKLAREYEARLKGKGGKPFMLRS
jgi:hypothetical protein